MIKNNAESVIDYLNSELEKSRKKNVVNNKTNVLDMLKKEQEAAKNELKVTMQQRIRDIMKNPENAAYIEELYKTMEDELNNKIALLGAHAQKRFAAF